MYKIKITKETDERTGFKSYDLRIYLGNWIFALLFSFANYVPYLKEPKPGALDKFIDFTCKLFRVESNS